MITVLVAVYNAQAYLKRCLDSLLRQTYTDLQVICIDDCSADCSWEILQRYASQDKRIMTLRLEENTGQAHARNVGIKYATGEYIAFLDSDDWLADDALEQVWSTFAAHPHTDCVLLHVVNTDGTGKAVPYPMQDFDCMEGEEAFTQSIDWNIHGVYVARAFLYHQFPFDETCKSYSDDNTTRIHYYNSREVRCCRGTYYYYQNMNSATRKTDISRLNQLKANESMKQQLIRLGVTDSMISKYENTRWLNVVDSYMFFYQHRHAFSRHENSFALGEIRRVWQTIETSRLNRNKHKFGYMPLKPCWLLFRLEEELYFTLRRFRCIRRLRKLFG